MECLIDFVGVCYSKMGSSDDFCLKWNDHHDIFFRSAERLCETDLLTDVTLSCGQREFAAHKLVLSVCSQYFAQLFAKAGKRPDPRQVSLRFLLLS